MITRLVFEFYNKEVKSIDLTLMEKDMVKNPFLFVYSNYSEDHHIINDLLSKIKDVYLENGIGLQTLFKKYLVKDFKMEFVKEQIKYSYSFGFSSDYNKIDYEKFEMIEPIKKVIIDRKNLKLDLSIFSNYFTEDEKRRLILYAYDLKYDNKQLVVSHLSRKYFDIDNKETVFDYVTECFDSLVIPKDEIISFAKFSSESLNSSFEFLEEFALTRYKSFELSEIDLNELRARLGRFLYDYLLVESNNYFNHSNQFEFITMIDQTIYVFKYDNDNYFSVYEVLINGRNLNTFNIVFKKLIFNFNIIFSRRKATNFVFNDLFDLIEVRLACQIINKLHKYLLVNQHKIITTTTNPFVLDLDILNRDEVMFVLSDTNNLSVVKLKDFKLRSDKVLSKGYLEGIFDKL